MSTHSLVSSREHVAVWMDYTKPSLYCYLTCYYLFNMIECFSHGSLLNYLFRQQTEEKL